MVTMSDISVLEGTTVPDISDGDGSKHAYLWRMPADLWARLRAEAQRQGCDVKDVLEACMSAALDGHQTATHPPPAPGMTAVVVPIPTPVADFLEALGVATGYPDLAQEIAAIVQIYLAELCGRDTPWSPVSGSAVEALEHTEVL
jgi:hypothetical protein